MLGRDSAQSLDVRLAEDSIAGYIFALDTSCGQKHFSSRFGNLRQQLFAMHPSFKNLQIGPFSSDYHREIVNEDFKHALFEFLETELLPQVESAYGSAGGKVVASYDNQKYCGPNSAVRDIYNLEFSFCRDVDRDTVTAELIFKPKTQSFTTRRGRPLYLWTASRRQRSQQEQDAIQSVCNRIASLKEAVATCPLCSTPLRITDSPALFDVTCPERCFSYHYHRNPDNGEFLHGHLFRKDPG